MRSRKLLIIALSFLVLDTVVLSVKAQNPDKPITFGARLGVNSSGFTQNYEVFTNKKTGFLVGGFVEFHPIKMAGISLDLNYAQQGAYHFDPNYIYTPAELNPVNNTRKVFTDIQLNTLTIPVLFNFRPVTEGNITPVLSLGIAFDFILSATANNWISLYDPTTALYRTLPTTNKENISSRFKNFNYGPVAGIGIDFAEKNIKYSFGLRYSLGLNDIDNSAVLNNVVSNSYRFHFSSNTLSVLVGVGF
jgi:hypothetical protein